MQWFFATGVVLALVFLRVPTCFVAGSWLTVVAGLLARLELNVVRRFPQAFQLPWSDDYGMAWFVH